MSARIGSRVWQAVAAELRRHRRSGLSRLLTEDAVRFATARALVDAGVDPASLRVEWPHPVLKGSRIDLVADGAPPQFIEFKYWREPNEQNAAWTMALGEVLKDFYRLATCPGPARRLFVYVETAQLHRYMVNAARRYGLDIDADEVVLRPADAARLPTTAAQIIGADLAVHHVEARRTEVVTVDESLRLAVYEVDALGLPPASAAARLASDGEPWRPPPAATHVPVRIPPQAERRPGPQVRSAGSAAILSGTRDGARREILAAIRAVLARTRRDTFTPAEVLAEMKRRGTGYAESTIRTMVTGHMCRNAPDNSAITYDDLERVDRGTYRLTRGEADR